MLARFVAKLSLGLFIAVVAFGAQHARADEPSIAAVDGRPALMTGAYDLGELGYEVAEYFVSGVAASYQVAETMTGDGNWNASPADTADYATRIVVIRPSDPEAFNGTVLVEWFNVTGGQDTPAVWMVAHREILRSGFAYVGVSAQKVGVDGASGSFIPGIESQPLTKQNPERYGALHHPGDAFSFDIYSQAGAALKAPGANGLLGPLVAERVLAMGESQSAAFLVTYINAVDPLAAVYDGFFVHSRFGGSAALSGGGMRGDPSAPAHVRYREDLRAPVLTFISETDLLGSGLSGYHAARQPDTDMLRVWEVAGAAHADSYLFGGAFMDSGLLSAEQLAALFRPSSQSLAGALDKPANTGAIHHYVVQAAISALDQWVRTDKPPASAPKLELAGGGEEGAEARLAVDDFGIARGGVRTPWVDAPTMTLTGYGNSGSFVAALAGVAEPFDAATLAELYPGGKKDYLKRFEKSLKATIKAGHILEEDRQEILDVAAINFDAAE